MNQNKKVWWIVGIGLVVIIIIMFATMGKPASAPTVSNSETTSGTEGSNPTTTGGNTPGTKPTTVVTTGKVQPGRTDLNYTLKQLVADGRSMKCTFVDRTSQAITQGTVYVVGPKLRGDFSITVDARGTNAHMIVLGNDQYIWIDGMNTGFKSSFNTPSTSTAGVDVNKSINYHCDLALYNANNFTLPIGVKF